MIAAAINQRRRALYAEIMHELLVSPEGSRSCRLRSLKGRDSPPEVIRQPSPLSLAPVQGKGGVASLDDGRGLAGTIAGNNPDHDVADLEPPRVKRLQGQPEVMAVRTVRVRNHVDQVLGAARSLHDPCRALQSQPEGRIGRLVDGRGGRKGWHR